MTCRPQRSAGERRFPSLQIPTEELIGYLPTKENDDFDWCFRVAPRGSPRGYVVTGPSGSRYTPASAIDSTPSQNVHRRSAAALTGLGYARAQRARRFTESREVSALSAARY
jgi:hypothetical protein